MISVDTNILVRAYLEDDLSQARLAQNLLKQTVKVENLFISSYTILEFVWVLKIKKFSRLQIHHAVVTLIDSFGVIVGQRQVVQAAIEKYAKGKADFGDYMILSEGETYGCNLLKTFDEILVGEKSSCTKPS